MNSQTNNNNIKHVEVNVSLQSLSPKQLLCECLDMATQFFKQLINYFCQKNSLQNPMKNLKSDFSSLINYMLQPMKIQQILQQFVGMDQKGKRALVKSWLFQLRQIRNNWAHNQQITYRICNRGFDTLSLIYDAFKGNKQSDLYKKIEFYRKSLLMTTAKKYVQQMNTNKNPSNNNNNFQYNHSNVQIHQNSHNNNNNSHNNNNNNPNLNITNHINPMNQFNNTNLSDIINNNHNNNFNNNSSHNGNVNNLNSNFYRYM